MSLSVLHGGCHISTITTLMSIWTTSTLDKLLLWKLHKFSFCDKVMTFDSSNSWESPAWTALSLILNICHSSFIEPIYGAWDVRIIKDFDISLLISRCVAQIAILGSFILKKSSILLFVPISEFVETKSVFSTLYRVTSFNLSFGLWEHSKTVNKFFFCPVWLSILSYIINEIALSIELLE